MINKLNGIDAPAALLLQPFGLRRPFGIQTELVSGEQVHNVTELLGDAMDFFHVESSRAEKCIVTFHVLFRSKAAKCPMALGIHRRGSHNRFFVKKRLEQFPIVIARRAGQHIVHLIDKVARIFE